MKKRLLQVVMVALAVLSLLAGCAAPTPAPAPTASPTLEPTQTEECCQRRPTAYIPIQTATSPASATPPPTSTSTATPVPTLTPTPMPTADTRLDPLDWKEWPVVPTLSARAKSIYQRGLALGNNPRAFSKVADCQGIREVLLGNYEKPGWYTLSPENAALQQTIDAFPGSFNRNGMAVMGGYNARAVLQPLVANPAFCLPGESPLECEYRVHRPSIAIVSLEFYYEGRTTQNYSAYLRQVIEFLIQRGVLPVLSTKADNMEGDHSLNLANARLAYEYDLPLWNFWRAAQPLTNKGMDLTRPDGFHISIEAWGVRSFTALQTLDSIRRAVKDLPPAAAVEKAGLPTPAPTPAAARFFEGAQTLPAPGAMGRVIFAAAQHRDFAYALQGVFLYDFSAGLLVRAAPEGFDLQAVSPDGTRALLNRGSELYAVNLDGSGADRLAEDFYPLGWPLAGAAWLPDGSALVYTANREGETGIYLASPDGANPRRLTAPGALPIGLLPSADAARVYWQSGVCRARGDCTRQAVWSSGLDGRLEREWPGMQAPEFSAGGQSAAYTTLNPLDQTVLSITDRARTRVWTPLPPGYAVDYAWSPSGRWLAALLLERNDYSGKPAGPRVFLLNTEEYQASELASASMLGAQAAWSPQGSALLVAGTEVVAGGYRLVMRLLGIPGGQVKQVVDGKIGEVSVHYSLFSRLVWIP